MTFAPEIIHTVDFSLSIEVLSVPRDCVLNDTVNCL